MTTRRPAPAQRLAELLETVSPEDRQEITAWLLEQGRPARAAAVVGMSWPVSSGEPPSRLTGALPVGEDSQLVTIRLPAERHARLRAWCSEHEFTMAAVVRGLVERFLEQQERAGARG
ncbi:MAG: hypothetical protein AUI14_14055 [Actinobacteria bacterium 13_2_20CM_2_71_6]|nr:MAG: hypothetical protein AUI14_14055 [Actinobacteria bacterium 13_2_20CM_2_71_6]